MITRGGTDLPAEGSNSWWITLTTYGNPQPFIEFISAAGATTTGEIRITAGGAPWLRSVDFYIQHDANSLCH